MVPLWRVYFFGLAPLMAQLLGAERAHYKYLPESVEAFYTRDELAGIFKDCGLTDVCIHELMLGTVCIHIGTKK
jgi:ubiquinone/menaquinone biosynthesis C-methylase UbiE